MIYYRNKNNLLSCFLSIVLNFQAKFGSICHTSSRFMLALGRHFPQLLTGLKFDVSKLSIRMKPIPMPNHAMHLIHCHVGYVTMKKSSETTSNIGQQKQKMKEDDNEKLMQKEKKNV